MNSSRRQFLGVLGFTIGTSALFTTVGFVPPSKKLIRPPGAINEREFLSKCILCHQCIDICPEGSLRAAHINEGIIHSGTPVIYKTCTVCLDCIKTCPTGALDSSTTEDSAKMGTAVVYEPCTGCNVCIHVCKFNAITAIDGEASVDIDIDKCNGCYACVEVCPIKGAIEVIPCEERYRGEV
ncbi:ferredoxin [Desulfitispora alkaliphila]|uniref:4Fe-4S binding protein n=1 Tax=Desulfitispora alkaliphila TaxID=622674 RepID=UPI003D1CFB00